MIRLAIESDSMSIAKLHHSTLTRSFLSKLGLNFLGSLYQFLIKKELVIVHSEENRITGFISFSQNSSGMMAIFLFTCPACVFKLLGILILSPGLTKRFLETFLAPFKSKSTLTKKGTVLLPSAELLSISVYPDCQATGIGSQLLNALEDYLRQNQILRYKVVAGVELVGANKFYLKNGFVLVNQIVIHGDSLSNVYTKELLKRRGDGATARSYEGAMGDFAMDNSLSPTDCFG